MDRSPSMVQEHPPAPPDAGRRPAGRRVFAIGVAAIVVLAGALVAGTLPRMHQRQQVDEAAAAAAKAPPAVAIAVAKRSAPISERVLPGTCLPLLEAALYARTTGYLKERKVDIGDRVQKDQLLAVISAPDIDAQLAQARANLAQARANLVKAKADQAFASSDLIRYQRMLAGKAASQEDYEVRVQGEGVASAAVVAMKAAIKVNEAAVQRYTDLQNFERITAPFAGVITARNVDPGDLLTADNTTGREMFHIMQTDVLRVWVNVPQLLAARIRVGQQASVFLQQDPTRKYPGKVARTANALDPKTRTLLTEVHVPNPKDALRPGMYLQVSFSFSREFAPLMVPGAALVTRSDGTLVGVLDEHNAVHYRKVDLGRDFGTQVEILNGLREGERIVVHPGDTLPDGTVVRPVAAPKSNSGS